MWRQISRCLSNRLSCVIVQTWRKKKHQSSQSSCSSTYSRSWAEMYSTLISRGRSPLINDTSDILKIRYCTKVIIICIFFLTFPSFQLELAAFDSNAPLKSATSQFIVNINLNPYAPVCQKSLYQIRINESVPVATPVLQVFATDQLGVSLVRVH